MENKPSFFKENLDYSLSPAVNKQVIEEFEKKDNQWAQYDSSVYQFGATFYDVLPANYLKIKLDPSGNTHFATIESLGLNFKEYIEDTLSECKEPLYAIEFGGPGSRLFKGFRKDLFNKTVGVCLGDERDSEQKKEDQKNGHEVIVADILQGLSEKSNLLDQKLENELGVKKVDLIISRMMGPLDYIETTPAMLGLLLQKWYRMLNHNGLIFAQFEYFNEHDPEIYKKYVALFEPEFTRNTERYVGYWVTQMNNNYSEYIDISLGRGIIRLHKKIGAPDKLPIIDMKDILVKK